MLIEGGYAFSMKALLEKSSGEELALAARRAQEDPSDSVRKAGLVAWIGQLWPVIGFLRVTHTGD
jgi:hypothetical protein